MTDTRDDEMTPQQRWGARTNIMSPGTHFPPPPPPGGDGTTTGHQTTPTPTQTRAQIVIRRIYCSCTTEAGHDEVYYLFGGVNGDAVETSHRGPDTWESADADNATAWDMNDSGAEQDRTLNATIYDQPLKPGQNATFACAFFESDGQDYGQTVAAAGKLASGVGDNVKLPALQIAGQILTWLGSLIPKNQDDLLGGMSLKLANDSGVVRITDLAAGTYGRVVSWDKASNRFRMGFRHDDGDYLVDFTVTGR